MKIRYLFIPVICFSAGFAAYGQTTKSDSAQVAKTLHELLRICRTINFADPNVSKLGTFYKAAPYIVYRGEDKARAWKTMCDYTKAYDKKGVDDICERINRTANQDSTGYRIIKYTTEKESEGVWHVLIVSYKRKGVDRTAAYAFLKIGNKFGLGDID